MRFQATFDRLSAALSGDDPLVALRQDPTGIAPERALVFVTAGSVSDFAKVAQRAGLEVFSEEELEAIEDYPEGFQPAGESASLVRTLYATIPTVQSFQRMLSLWRAHQRGENAPHGYGPWWNVFNLLLELRPWGPQDRLGADSRAIIEDRLAFREDDDPISIEFEIWPTASAEKRAGWRRELEQHVAAREGSILDRSSISEDGFSYEALLVELPCHAVRQMLANPADIGGLATLEGIQFIMPQTIGQALPGGADAVGGDRVIQGDFDSEAPIRAALLDGTPVAAHQALDGGVVIEDMHDLVRLSPVGQRYHATAMASLILRGDLQADGRPLADSRLVSVPVLIDREEGAETANNRLFVDVVHTTLMRLIGTDEPVAPDVFVVNFSIGVRDSHFSGHISALARLMDWWADREGLLFVVSAGNVGHLTLPETRMMDVEDAAVADRRTAVRSAMRDSIFNRTLLSPAESLNALTVGALSLDLVNDVPPQQAGETMEHEWDLGDEVRTLRRVGLQIEEHRRASLGRRTTDKEVHRIQERDRPDQRPQPVGREIPNGQEPESRANQRGGQQHPEIVPIPAPPVDPERQRVHHHQERQHDRRGLRGPHKHRHERDGDHADATPETALGDTDNEHRDRGGKIEPGLGDQRRAQTLRRFPGGISAILCVLICRVSSLQAPSRSS